MFENSVQERLKVDLRSVVGALAGFAIMVVSGYLLIAR